MEPPIESLKNVAVFPSSGKVVGLFAGHKIALIQTDMGSSSSDYVQSAIDTFPSARFIIAIGVAYAVNCARYRLGDVLVSKSISDLKNLKFDKNGRIVNRGQIVDIVNELKSLFCMDLTFEADFEVARNGRVSSVYCGRYASYSALFEDKEMRDKFCAAVPEVIGGDMEGGELLRFQQGKKIEGIIVIKGVAGYADGSIGKEWHFTAALAALKYTKSKLLYYQHKENVASESCNITSNNTLITFVVM